MTIQPGDRNGPDPAAPPKGAPAPRGNRTPPAPVPEPPVPAETETAKPTIPPTRVGTIWVALCAAALLSVALIVFLLQNTGRTQVSFLWMQGSAPLAVMLLIAAVAAALATALLGTARITQLRRLSRHRTTQRP